jgi:hypothetical protein
MRKRQMASLSICLILLTLIFIPAKAVMARPGPELTITPGVIDDPTWTKRSVEKDTIVRLENIGDAVLNFSAITPVRLTGTSYDWLGLINVPTSISNLTPNYADMTVQLNKGGAYTSSTAVGFDGLVVFEGDFVSSPDTLKIHLIIADTVQIPVVRAIRTAKKRLAINNAGNLGNGGAPDSAMNFFNDCDTMNNIEGADDNAKIYLKDASPFIMRINGNDTIIYSYYKNNDWLNGTGFRPVKGLTVDSSRSDYQYAYTGQYLTSDSMIGVESWYWAPLAIDSSDFIIQKLLITNKSSSTIANLYVGELMDWNIPSDSGVENGSDYDATRNLMYMFGGEYGADTGIYAEGSNGNDCILADQRVGGFSFYKGIKRPAASPADTFATMQGAMTLMNDEWTTPSGNFVPGQLWNKLQGFSGYQPWQSTQPGMEDSLYQDLSMVAVFGQYSLNAGASLGFIKILATGNSGAEDLKVTIDKARQWITNHRAFIEAFGCCVLRGDANHDGKLDLRDVSYIINKLYKWGPNFVCPEEADVNADGKVNLSDISYLICIKYRGCPQKPC